MKYAVKTIYGVSKSNYAGTPFEPLFGTGQGSGASPAAWLTLVVILMNTMDRIIPERMAFKSPDGKDIQERLMDAFVDDTSLGFTNDGTLAFPELTNRLREIVQTWEQLLHYSGGALNLKKCSWHILFWEWKSGRPVLRPIKENDNELRLYQGSDTQHTHPIQRTKVTDASRILGVYLSPNGDFSKQIQVLRDKAGAFAILLKSPRLSPTDIRIFHKTMYGPAMKYPLPAMAVDEEELNCIQTSVIPAMLQKLGINRNLPTAIRHGPTEFGGMALLDLRTELGIETIKYLRNAVYAQSATGLLIILTLKHLQQEAGIGEHLLECPDIHIPYLTPTWITSIRQYMSNHNLTITITDVSAPQLNRAGDSFIMTASHLARYSAIQQKDINLVRTYLQATFLSDLAAPDGKTITSTHLTGERASNFTSTTIWPRQETPTKAQQRLWRKYISSSYLRYPPHLLQRIGPPPPPAPVLDALLPTTQPSVSYPSLQAYITALPRTHRRLLSNYTQICGDQELWRAFRSRRRLQIISDGGLHETRGTFGWKIVTHHDIVLYQGSGPVDGPFELSNSTRCEIGGFAASLLLVTVISKYWGIRHQCKFHWIVDSTAAISKVSITIGKGPPPCKQPNKVDLLAFIAQLTKELRRPIKISWVKGHQDKHTPYEQLSRLSKLNVDVDILATNHRLHEKSQSSPNIDHLPSSRISIALNGLRLTSKIDTAIRYHVNGYHMRQYLQQKHSWSDSVWDSIDFYLFGRHFNQLTPAQQTGHMKVVHDQQHLGKRRLQQSTIKDPVLQLCPCCKVHPETQFHHLQCTANTERQAIFSVFKRSICTSDIHPVRYILSAGILHWLSTPDEPFRPSTSEFPSHHHDILLLAIEEQNHIGWHKAVLGYLGKTWQRAASLHMYNSEKGHDTTHGNNVILQILKALYAVTRSLWLSRNSSLHDAKDDVSRQIQSADSAEIRHYHAKPHLLPTGDQHYCESSLTRLLSSSPAVKRRWLRQIRQARATKL